MHGAIPADLRAAPRCFEKMCFMHCSVKYMIILITPVTHEYISVLRKNKTESIYSVYKTVSTKTLTQQASF